MANVRAYIQRHYLSLLNAAVIGVVYVVGLVARPHASFTATMRIFDWLSIAPEVMFALLILSALLMASPWYSAKYAAIIAPGLYAASVFGYVSGNDGLSLVTGLEPVAVVLMMAWGVRMEQRAHENE